MSDVINLQKNMLQARIEQLNERIQTAQEQNIYPYMSCSDQVQGVHITIQGRPMLQFASYSYLDLLGHPKIETVSIVGVPHARLGDVGAAFIRLKKGQTATEEEIMAYCKAGIADIKVPRYVFFVEEFPLNPQGKIQKFKQREWAIQKLGLKERK